MLATRLINVSTNLFTIHLFHNWVEGLIKIFCRSCIITSAVCVLCFLPLSINHSFRHFLTYAKRVWTKCSWKSRSLSLSLCHCPPILPTRPPPLCLSHFTFPQREGMRSGWDMLSLLITRIMENAWRAISRPHWCVWALNVSEWHGWILAAQTYCTRSRSAFGYVRHIRSTFLYLHTWLLHILYSTSVNLTATSQSSGLLGNFVCGCFFSMYHLNIKASWQNAEQLIAVTNREM